MNWRGEGFVGGEPACKTPIPQFTEMMPGGSDD